MTTETKILTDEFISALWDEIHAPFSRETFRMSHHDFARHIEAAVLQSPEIQALRKDAERLDWMDNVAHCADWVEDEPTKRVIRADDGAEFQGDTWRAAIDTAMEQKP